jgi:beta-lactam-binding protein with PASTA domain
VAVSHAGRGPASGAGLTDLVGRVLTGRYRLVAPIGVGASAQVFLADDVQLRRRVAVKLLHAGLAGDPTFLRRFQAEAQSAAALNHPNVVAVYDWGEDGVPFIVTEFLDGGSLRAILDRGARLTVSQALLVGLEACRALHYAHTRGFVHRDIKPANLLYGEDRRLRVADFGLARALAEASWTEPEGVVLGTARYVSPEQAAGHAVDTRSDVYSLALVLVECVTGEVPHAADTALATLRARMGASIEADPERLGSLAPLIEAAGTAEVEPRWTAAQLGQALMRAAEQLPPPAPIPLAPTTIDETVPDGGPATTIYVEPAEGLVLDTAEGTTAAEPTADGAPGGAAAGGAAASGAPIGSVFGTAPQGAAPAGHAPADAAPARPAAPAAGPIPVPVPLATPGTGAGDDAADDGEDGPSGLAGRGRKGRRRKRRFGPARVALLTLVLAAVGVLAALLAGLVDLDLGGAEVHTVEDYVGNDLAVARARIDALDAGWVVEVRDGRADGAAVNSVIEQRPLVGTELREGSTVELVRSIGPEQVVVPALVGRPFDDPVVKQLFAEASLAVRRVDAFDEVAPVGEIVAIDEVARWVDKGTTIDVTVSAGPEPRTLADYAGQPADKVVADLAAKGLAPTAVEEASETVAKGNVVRTDPPAATQVPKGAPISVVVSSGRPKLTVPSLAGYTGREAEDELSALGWNVIDVDGPTNAMVIGTDPPAGAVRDKGSNIRVFTQQN